MKLHSSFIFLRLKETILNGNSQEKRVLGSFGLQKAIKMFDDYHLLGPYLCNLQGFHWKMCAN